MSTSDETTAGCAVSRGCTPERCASEPGIYPPLPDDWRERLSAIQDGARS